MYIEAVGNKHFKKENQNSIDVLVFIYSAILHSWNFASTNYFVFKKKNNIDLTKFKNLFKIFKENVFFLIRMCCCVFQIHKY